MGPVQLNKTKGIGAPNSKQSKILDIGRDQERGQKLKRVAMINMTLGSKNSSNKYGEMKKSEDESTK